MGTPGSRSGDTDESAVPYQTTQDTTGVPSVTQLPRAAIGQPSKVASRVASGSLLPPTECSLRSGCTVDERHGAGTHTSTLRGRRRAIRLTWVSLSVGKHDATAPALVRART